MNHRFFLCVTPLILCGFFACNETSINPQPPPQGPDTTSSRFVFDISYFGDNTSWIKDVFAISNDNVWAVGDLAVYDSIKKKLVTYNALHWDGKSWSARQVPSSIKNPDGSILHSITDAMKTVYAPSKGDIWFVSEFGSVTRLQDSSWFEMIFDSGPGPANKMWGKSNDLYFAIDQGFVTHWNGYSFTRLQTGLNYDCNDIRGSGDTAICVASNWDSSGPTKIIRIVNGTVSAFPDSGLYMGMKSLWFERQNRIFCAGHEIDTYNGTKWSFDDSAGFGFLMIIRGTAENDIFAAGHYANVVHYNGRRWAVFPEIDPTKQFYLMSLAYLNGEVWIVGGDQRKGGVMIHGKRF